MRLFITLALLFDISVSTGLDAQSISFTSSAVQPLGRVNPATGELTWPASGISFNFTGTSATVPIKSSWGSNRIEIIVDGGTPLVIDNVTGSSITTPPNLSNGQHNVVIRKMSEALYGSIYLGDPVGSTILSPGVTTKKRIEIIGDSISVGYGIDGPYPCVNSAAVEDGTHTYGALTAKNLSADYSIVAWSGKGVTRNYVTTDVDTSPLMPELWTRYGANDADNSYDFKTPADIVVINLGTNDFSYVGVDASGKQYSIRDQLNATTYTTALVNFTKAVQGKYPNAVIFMASSPMLGDFYPTAEEAQHTKQEKAIKSAIAQLGDKVHFVSFPSQDSSNNNIGCDYHPSPLTHQQMAVILTAAIKQVVG
jgi:lysophospholipase L1-like esterase